jgi:heat shock protein HslJ
MFHRTLAMTAVFMLAGTAALAQGGAEPTLLLQQAPPSPDRAPAKSLTGTHWTLTQLNGQAITAQSGKNEAYIELTADTNRIAGSGGCNRIMGSYELEGSSLRFKQVASTMMACPGDAMPREQEFIKALNATASFRIRGAALLLRGKDDTVLARLEAQTSTQP